MADEHRDSGRIAVLVALNLLPFAAISFLWSIGVGRMAPETTASGDNQGGELEHPGEHTRPRSFGTERKDGPRIDMSGARTGRLVSRRASDGRRAPGTLSDLGIEPVQRASSSSDRTRRSLASTEPETNTRWTEVPAPLGRRSRPAWDTTSGARDQATVEPDANC